MTLRGLSWVHLQCYCMVLAGCAAGPAPCRTASGCSPTQECLANRCALMGSDPVNPTSERRVITPNRFAVSQASSELWPSSARLGGPRAQRLFLDFDLEWESLGDVQSAFLLVYPAPGSADSRPVHIRVDRLDSDWSASGVAKGSLPSLAGGGARAIAAGDHLVRVDVSHLLHGRLSHPTEFRGFSVSADEDASGGFVASTGVNGRSPRLELYVVNSNRQSSSTRTDD